MTNLKWRENHILAGVMLISVFLLALCKIEDTDAWTHFSIGRAIFEQGGLPARELFTYPSLDKPFISNSWLFGLVFYLTHRAFDVYGVILLKAAVVTIAFFILFRDALRPYKNALLSALILFITAVMIRHRFVERPDIFLMVYLSFCIFSLNAYLSEGKKYLYFLPLVHLAWANTHVSIIFMAIPFGAFIFGGLIEQVLAKRGLFFSDTPASGARIRTMSLVFLGSFAASLINPNFISQYTAGFAVVDVSWWKDEVAELQRPTWETFKQPFIMAAMFVFSTALGWFAAYRSRSVMASAQDRTRNKGTAFGSPSLIHIFLVVPFMVLAFSAIRFVFLFCIVAAPVVVRNLSAFADQKEASASTLRRWAVTVFAVAGMIFFTSAAITKTLPLSDEEKQFGFGINTWMLPEGALRYMDREGIAGRIFNTYQLGGYITWRDFARRSAFVDGRGYLAPDLLEKVNLARHRPDVLDDLQRNYGFEAVIVTYPIDVGGISAMEYGIDRSLTHTGWALVYWDDASLLYLRRGGPYSAVINKDEYRFIKPGNLIKGATVKLQDRTYRANFVKELLRNVAMTDSSTGHMFLGFVYNETGLYQEAIEEFSKVRNTPVRNFVPAAYAGTAHAFGKLDNIDKSLEYYEKSLDMNEDATTCYKAGMAYLAMGKREKAVRYFERALKLNENLLSVYSQLINAYRQGGDQEKAEEAARRYGRARVSSEAEEHFNAGVKAYLTRSYQIAIAEFVESLEVNPSNPVAYSNLGYIYYDLAMDDKAYEYQRKAVDIDPSYANAHYGLALIYKRRGNPMMAKEHWEEYLKLEPAGYYARKAKQEIELIK